MFEMCGIEIGLIQIQQCGSNKSVVVQKSRDSRIPIAESPQKIFPNNGTKVFK